MADLTFGSNIIKVVDAQSVKAAIEIVETNLEATRVDYNTNVTKNDAADVKSKSWTIDEDDMSSDLDTKVPTQQSVKAYADGLIIDEDDMVSDLDTKVPTQQSVKAYADERTPPGSIMLWPTDTAPTGWLECAGASLLRAGAYNPLYLVIGDAYGAADGTHFNLPDWSGLFLRSWDHGAGIDTNAATRTVPGATGATISAGDHVGTEQDEQFKSHHHSTNVNSNTQPVAVDTASAANDGSSDTGDTGGDETRPINVNVMVIIKY